MLFSLRSYGAQKEPNVPPGAPLSHFDVLTPLTIRSPIETRLGFRCAEQKCRGLAASWCEAGVFGSDGRFDYTVLCRHDLGALWQTLHSECPDRKALRRASKRELVFKQQRPQIRSALVGCFSFWLTVGSHLACAEGPRSSASTHSGVPTAQVVRASSHDNLLGSFCGSPYCDNIDSRGVTDSSSVKMRLPSKLPLPGQRATLPRC